MLIGWDCPECVHVTEVWSGQHPAMSWTKPVLYLGTTEFTSIPEDRNGRVLFSPDGGDSWQELQLPNIAVSAITASLQNPHLATTLYLYQVYSRIHIYPANIQESAVPYPHIHDGKAATESGPFSR